MEFHDTTDEFIRIWSGVYYIISHLQMHCAAKKQLYDVLRNDYLRTADVNYLFYLKWEPNHYLCDSLLHQRISSLLHHIFSIPSR